eukprot:CAMPEP_0114571706 /NCGR_PEP_ID=MMETSP0114-20121206/17883_1 /TAXON_ID=31324 /ORGANISM="Goniomonas sp, Strain m" /LENGTH=324 /DNA_ID=CAMNT_0001758831 /DNA_START=70 /DNA_END=1045 /DNA_ORIENTATION=+
MKLITQIMVTVLILQSFILVSSQKLVVREDSGPTEWDSEGEPAPIDVAPKKRQASNPMTRLLEVAVDNADHNSLHERAEAIRKGLAEPMTIDREVLDALFPNPLVAMKRLTDVINDLESKPEDVASNLLALEDYVQDIDNANDLYKIDGIKIVNARLSLDNTPEVIQNAAWVLGTLVQSNPQQQEMVPPEEALEAEDGVAGVVHLLNDADADSVMKRKAATFVTDIVTDRPSFADKLVKLGVCEGILPLLQSNETAVQEKAMEALETLIGAAPSTARLLNTLEAKKSLAELRARTDEAAKADPELVEHIFRHLDVLHGMLTNNP